MLFREGSYGPGVTAFEKGDEVYGMAGGVGGLQGTLAEFAAVDIDLLARKPANLSMRQAAALPLSVITAWEGLVDIVYDTVGGATLDASFASVKRYTGHVLSSLGGGAHSLAPLSFRGATYSGVFTLLPLITGENRAHHGEIPPTPRGLPALPTI